MKVVNDEANLKAQKLFTDREEFRTIIINCIDEVRHNPDDLHVVNFYGVGGIGKTELCNNIIDELLKFDSEVKYAKHDFEQSVEVIDVLTYLKNDLIRRYSFRFPVFEYAVYQLALKCGKDKDVRQMESIIENNPSLRMIHQVAGLIPVASTIANVLSAADKTIRQIYNLMEEQKIKRTLYEIEILSLQDLKNKLHKYFSIDLKENMKDCNTPLVVILDTYEKLVNEANGIGQPLFNDLWLRDTAISNPGLILLVPNLLWVIAGREMLKWNAIDKNWDKDSLQTHIVGNLSPTDSYRYLKMAGVLGHELREEIFERTKGIPIHLDLCVDQYYKLIDRNILPVIDEFDEEIGKLTERYLRYMGDSEKELLFLMSCTTSWTDDHFIKACKEISINLNNVTYSKLKTLSFCNAEGDANYSIQSDVKKILRKACPNELKNKYICFLTKLIENSQVDNYKYILEKVDLELERIYSEDQMTEMMFLEIVNGIVEEAEYLLDNFMLSKFEQLMFQLWKIAIKNKKAEAYRIMAIIFAKYNLLLGNYKESQSILATFRTNAYEEDDVILELIAETEFYLGNYNNALLEYEKVYLLKANRSLNESVECAFIKEKMGTTMSYLGRFEEALEIKKSVVVNYYSVLGCHHRKSLMLMNSMARDYSGLGKYSEAYEINSEVYPLMKEVFGELHPITLRTSNNLARDLSGMKRFEEAYKIKSEVYEKTRDILGEQHPDTIFCLSSLSSTLSHLGRHKEALEMNQMAYDTSRTVSGEEHPDTFHSKLNLSVNLANNGRMKEAINLCTDSFLVAQRVWGKLHPVTQVAARNLIEYESSSKIEDMSNLTEELNEYRYIELKNNHPDMLLFRRMGPMKKSL